MGIQSVAIYSEADANARHVLDADEAYCVGPAPAAESYLNVEKILQVAQESGVQGIHPGYGFLSENAGFAERCESLGIAFIGPTPQQMRDFGLKHTARALAEKMVSRCCRVPVYWPGLKMPKHKLKKLVTP